MVMMKLVEVMEEEDGGGCSLGEASEEMGD